MSRRTDEFISMVCFNIGIFGLIALWVYACKSGLMLISGSLLGALYFVSIFCPMGPTILFIALKLLHKTVMGWGYLAVVAILSMLMLDQLLKILRHQV
jgi:hypothetical protein